MPGGKRRLKFVFTGGIQVGPAGSPGDFARNILAGSFTANSGSAVAGSTGGVLVGTITGLTACHMLVATLEGTTGCFGVAAACPGSDSASVLVANWSSSTAASKALTVRYLGVRTAA